MERGIRLLVYGLSALAALIYLRWLATTPEPVLAPGGRFAHSMIAFHVGLRAKLPQLSFYFTYLAAFTGLFVCALACIVITRAHGNVPAARLSLGFALVAFSYAVLAFAEVYPEFRALLGVEGNLAWQAVIDALNYGLLGLGVFFLWRFFRGFPNAVDFDKVLSHQLSKEIKAREALYTSWRRRLYPRSMWDPSASGYLASSVQRLASIQRIGDFRLRYWRFLESPTCAWALIASACVVAGLHALARWSWPGTSLAQSLPDGLFMAAMAPFYWLLIIAVMLLGTAFVFLQYHHQNGSVEDRRKIQWVYIGIAAGFFLFVTPVWLAILSMMGYVIFGSESGPPFQLDLVILAVGGAAPFVFMVILALSLTFSMMYRGALDPRLAARKITVWWALGLLAAFLFVLIERALAMQITHLLNLSPETGPLIAGALVAATIAPVRGATDRVIARWVARYLPVNLVADGEQKQIAIALSDVSGYSALAAKNERQSLLIAALLVQQAELITATHGGRVVKAMGDAVLMAFDSAASAIKALEALHERFPSNAASLGLPALPLHSGLHVGEVTIGPDGDIFGHAVNLTARIQAQAGDGEILLSHAAMDAASLLAEQTKTKGMHQLKNIPEPVELFQLSGRAS